MNGVASAVVELLPKDGNLIPLSDDPVVGAGEVLVSVVDAGDDAGVDEGVVPNEIGDALNNEPKDGCVVAVVIGVSGILNNESVFGALLFADVAAADGVEVLEIVVELEEGAPNVRLVEVGNLISDEPNLIGKALADSLFSVDVD